MVQSYGLQRAWISQPNVLFSKIYLWTFD